MKIAYLLESGELSGGSKVILMHAEALALRGHEVAVVSPRPAPEWFRLEHAAFEASPFESSARIAGADVVVATFYTTVQPALNRARGPVFHLCQGYEGEITHYRTVWPEIAEIYSLPTRKLAVSRTLAERLTGMGFGPVDDVGQAFDARLFRPGPPRPAGDPPVVLVVGPLEVDFKGVDVALGGLKMFRERGGRFRLHRASYFPAGARDGESEPYERFHHHVAPERMPLVYQAADAFIGGSRLAEGFGLPSLEALSCGVASLLSDVPGQKEIGGDAAWYFWDGDPEAVADALPQLLTDAARSRARVAGPERAARWDTAKVAERLEGAFRRALEGR